MLSNLGNILLFSKVLLPSLESIREIGISFGILIAILLIGSIYLDRGYSSVEKFILELWSDNIKDSIVTQIDAKTKLQEFSLKRFKKLPIYKLVSNTGPRHKPLFKVGVKLIDTKFYFAEGNSKKDAEQNAAIKCLQNHSIS